MAACAIRSAVTGLGRAAGSHAVSASNPVNTGSARCPSGATRVTVAMSTWLSTGNAPLSSTTTGSGTIGTRNRPAATALITLVSSPASAATKAGSAPPESVSKPLGERTRPPQVSPAESVASCPGTWCA